MKKGFTLIETLVGTAVFLIVALALYQVYFSLFLLIGLNQYKIIALNLANEEFEIIRNLPYASVGEVSGIPNGVIAHSQVLNRGGINFNLTTTIRNVDIPFDGTIGGTPNDLSPADNKLVEVQVDCPTCKNFTPITLTTTIAPKNLETASTNGALFVKVFDANGIPVEGANVHVVNSKVSPTITIDDVTDINGMLQIVDAPPGVQAYNITVSKSGYSTSRTYAPNPATNPDPTQPDATVVVQQVTQVSFSIDHVSTFTFSSVSPTCTAVPGIDFSLVGAKTIGTDLPKYSQNLATNGSGIYTNSSMEWDDYLLTGTDAAYDIAGLNPLNSIPLNPGSTQAVMMVVSPKAPKSLLVTVKDSSTMLPVTGANVELTKSGYDSLQVTDRGYINQTDWSGGSGQASYVDATKYFFDDAGVDINTPNGEIKLKNAFGSYNSSGSLESSTIDTGSPSNFHNLIWLPVDQPLDTGTNSAKFQIATNVDLTATTTWDYKGPDGTAATFYTVANSGINSAHNGGRFVRYKVFLSTLSATSTPNVSDVAFTYTSQCTPPGQVLFSNLGGALYHLQVSKTGYTTFDENIDISADWFEKSVILAP